MHIDRSTLVFIKDHNVASYSVATRFVSLILHPRKENGNKGEKKERKNRNVLFDHPN